MILKVKYGVVRKLQYYSNVDKIDVSETVVFITSKAGKQYPVLITPQTELTLLKD